MRLAFVSAPTGSTFMTEILSAIAGAVQEQGATVIEHTGTIDDLDDHATAFVVVPHEYFTLSPTPSASALARTIAYGVEHPGTGTFDATVATATLTAARFELSAESVAALRARGIAAEHFPLGYTARWDHWHESDRDRPVDLAFMGTVDPRRLRLLARLASDLTGLETEILIPPHEQMTEPRPDFLIGESKWNLLAHTKLLLNLHREENTALESVRVLEAACNGCVVLSEPSSDMGPFRAGRHLLIAHPDRLGAVLRAALGEPDRLREIAVQAYRACREQLDMSADAARLVALADALLARPTPRIPGARSAVTDDLRDQNPSAEAWLPVLHDLSAAVTAAASNPDRPSARRGVSESSRWTALAPPASSEVDVICVAHPGAGPAGLTAMSLCVQDVPANLYLAGIDRSGPPDLPGLVSYLHCPEGTSLGAARNALLARGTAPFVLVLEAGDEVLPGALEAMLERLREDPALSVSFPLAADGSEGLLNVFVPEQWRLERHAYLTRGYLVRRTWFDEHGAYPEAPALDALLDHDFWLRASWHGATAHLRRIGIRLWPTRHEAVTPPSVEVLYARLGIDAVTRRTVMAAATR